MTTAFLNFAKPQPLQLEEVSVEEVLKDCTRELKSLYEKRKVELVTERTSNVPNINADARMLRQALLNVLRNAAEAITDETDNRKVSTRIATATVNGQRTAVVTVHDTGPGIAPANLQKVFIPFFTTKASGHGVGLPLAHRIIAQHGGSLTAANAPEGGAIFTICLPCD
jgi:signal transduction histidine kinase